MLRLADRLTDDIAKPPELIAVYASLSDRRGLHATPCFDLVLHAPVFAPFTSPVWAVRLLHMHLLTALWLQDRRWQYIRAGCPEDYHGPAVHPRHLSLWEKWVLGIHKQWDPEADAQVRREAEALKREDSAEGLSRESSVFLQRASVAKRDKLVKAELGQGQSVKK